MDLYERKNRYKAIAQAALLSRNIDLSRAVMLFSDAGDSDIAVIVFDSIDLKHKVQCRVGKKALESNPKCVEEVFDQAAGMLAKEIMGGVCQVQ